MKNKTLIITTIIFFLLVNTTYYWESKLGVLAIPEFLFLVIVFFILLIILLQQFFLTIKEKFGDRQRLLIVALMTIVLALAFFKPAGLIDFEKFEGNVLIAQREGAANCMTTFKLKENNKFTEKSVCFGITEIRGDYTLKNDTIFFENVVPGRGESGFYKFAVIQPSKFNKDHKHFDLVRYKDLKDTIGSELWIIKNDLYKPGDKKPNRGMAVDARGPWLRAENIPQP